MAALRTIPQTTLHLGGATVEVYPGYTVTSFLGGPTLTARHDDCAHLDQAQTAQALGYPSVAAMNSDHDVLHSLLAVWLGVRYSPTLYGLATGTPWPHAAEEEAVVLALQRLLTRLGLEAPAVAARQSPRA